MKKDEWQKIKTVVELLVEAEAGEHPSILEKHCGGDTELAGKVRKHYESIREAEEFWSRSQTLSKKILEDTATLHAFTEPESLEGKRIGVYQVHKKIGEGGMGDVYLAERDDGRYRRDVAIKLMRMSLHLAEVRNRFVREQQILARLNHPGIAQLYNAGVTEAGNPYLVMEYVNGKNLLEFAAETNLGIRQRLELMLKVCEAVEFAHRNLIVHRDLKPDNILVKADGELKILDFGIAKLMDESLDTEHPDLTRESTRLYSLSYASPEQILQQPITVSSDIYSLGLLLFELLCEQKPFSLKDLDRANAEAMLVNKTPPLLSSTNSEIEKRGDLDAVVAKCLRKEPGERYLSITELMQDLQNYMNDQPVKARKGTVMYLSRKFWRRNKAAISVALFVLLGILALSVFYTQRINQEKLLAVQESQRAQLVSDYLIGLFENADPLSADGKDQTIVDFLNNSISDLSGLEDDPVLQEEAAFTLGHVALNLGGYDNALSLFHKSLEVHRSVNESPTLREAEIFSWLGQVQQQQANYRYANQYYDSVLTIRKVLLESDHPELASTYLNIAVNLAHLAQVDSANTLVERSLEILGDSRENYDQMLMDSYVVMAEISREEQDYLSSVKYEQAALALLSDTTAQDNSVRASLHNNLGYAMRMLERYEEAISHYEQALVLMEELLGTAHPRVLVTLNNLASAHNLNGNSGQAYASLLERHKRIESAFGEMHWRTGSSYAALATFQFRVNDLEESEAYHIRALEVFTETLGEDHFWTLREQLKYILVQSQSRDVGEVSGRFNTAVETLYETTQQPLSYYDRSGLMLVRDQYLEYDLPEMSRKITAFIDWHDTEFESGQREQ